ncbi:uncharacterized protein BDV14DRAFT_167135 [Aspergillus stella-maris]|uniref:uncharacterized protein n=1 Tax=Aspergillus stella-maris TaxID=1810926 RepID=UPI003CCD60C8
MPVEPSLRLKRRKFLVELEATVTAIEGHEINPIQLKQNHVQLQHMSLDEHSEEKPHFFLPYPDFPQPDEDDEIDELRDALDDEGTCFTRPMDRARTVYSTWSSYAFDWAPGKPQATLWSAGCVADHTPYKPVIDHNRQLMFGALDITDIRQPAGRYPHSKAVIYNNWMAKDGEILRGELLAVLRLMLGRLKKTHLIKHMTAPVLMLSFMGKRARAVESYYDGRDLYVRISRFYDFPEETESAFKTFAEWYHGDPEGNTLA